MTMNYLLLSNGSIFYSHDDGGCTCLPAENNGTPEWREYQAWLEAGNTPEPAPVPPPPPPSYVAFWDALIVSTVYGSIRSDIYHLPGSGWIDEIKPWNLRVYSSPQEAESRGLRRAKNNGRQISC